VGGGIISAINPTPTHGDREFAHCLNRANDTVGKRESRGRGKIKGGERKKKNRVDQLNIAGSVAFETTPGGKTISEGGGKISGGKKGKVTLLERGEDDGLM